MKKILLVALSLLSIQAFAQEAAYKEMMNDKSINFYTVCDEADKYFETFFEYFDIIAERPFSFKSVNFIKEGYRCCVCGSDSIYYKEGLRHYLSYTLYILHLIQVHMKMKNLGKTSTSKKLKQYNMSSNRPLHQYRLYYLH